MAASFPSSVRSLAVPAAGDGILYSDVADVSEEVTALLTAFVNGRARASAYHSTTQSLTSGTPAALNLDSEDFDVGTMHDLVTTNNRVTIPASNAGVYLIVGGSTFAASATGYRQLEIRKNAATVLQTAIIPVNSGSQLTTFQATTVASLAAADFIDLVATQNSGGPLTAGNAVRAFASFLQVIRIW